MFSHEASHPPARAENSLLAQFRMNARTAIHLPTRMVGLYWLLDTSVQKSLTFISLISLFPGHKTRLRNKGNLFFSLESERKHASGKTNRYLRAECAPGSQMDARRKVLFLRILTHDDDCLAPLVSLKRGRRGSLRFKPPADNHGADRLRSVQQPPWLPREQ